MSLWVFSSFCKFGGEKQLMQLQTYKTITKLLFIFSTLSITAVAQERKSTIVLSNVTLIDMTSQQPKPNMTVSFRAIASRKSART
jgi:hypothetical protein